MSTCKRTHEGVARHGPGDEGVTPFHASQRTAPRKWRRLAVAPVCMALLGLGMAAPASAAPRLGMTWRVLDQQGGYVHVGRDDQTNAYQGDTTVDQMLPVLCVLKDGRAAPGGIAFDFSNGWVQGALQLTQPIAGSALTAQAQADGICANAFGAGWRMAEFHDGRYGPGFTGIGGWSFWGQAQLPTDTRFWVAINDQPANPWNSAGDPPPVDPPDPNYSQRTVQTGTGWQLVQTGGTLDDTGAAFNEQFYMIDGQTGLNGAPLPQQLKDAIAADIAATPAGEAVTYSVSKSIADEIQLSVMQGAPTQRLIDLSADPGGVQSMSPAGVDRFGILGCGDKDVTKNKAFNWGSPINSNYNIGDANSGFTGNVSLSGTAQVNANGEIAVTLKRAGFWKLCVPYGVKLRYARVNGTALIDQGATVSGSITYANPKAWEWQIAKPFLFSINFMAGPIPVHIGFNLPITAGFDKKGITATVTGSVSYSGRRSVSGYFDYSCTSSGCSGSSSLDTTDLGSQPVTASVSGRFQPSLYAQVAFRGYLYSDSVAYAQLGIRPYVFGDLWGFYGNNCGDADGDGTFETVDALTFDLDWQLRVTGQADTFLTKQWRKDIWTSQRWHAQFWDLLGGAGSRALTPVAAGPGTVPAGVAQTYTAKMRSCWPYADNVDFSLDWGDGSAAQAVNGPASTGANATHTWAQTGSPLLRLTALRDAHGRNLGKATQRTVTVNNAHYHLGMTWKLLGTNGSYAHVGSDTQTNAYQGDTNPSTALPVLCLRQDGRAAPSGITFDFSNGWAQGEIRLTAPVQGLSLTSRAVADNLCASTFGSGFRMAEFHDGNGGWTWWAQGVISGASRFWVAINDQPANPWN